MVTRIVSGNTPIMWSFLVTNLSESILRPRVRIDSVQCGQLPYLWSPDGTPCIVLWQASTLGKWQDPWEWLERILCIREGMPSACTMDYEKRKKSRIGGVGGDRSRKCPLSSSISTSAPFWLPPKWIHGWSLAFGPVCPFFLKHFIFE